MRVTAWLRGLDMEELAGVCRARAEVCERPPRTIEELARRLSGAESVAAAVAGLDRDAVLVAQSLVVLGDGCQVAGLRAFVLVANVEVAFVPQLVGQPANQALALVWCHVVPPLYWLAVLCVGVRSRTATDVNLLLSRPMDGPNALALGERLLEIFADAGLTPDDAARASYLFTTYVLGSIALEAAELEHSGPPPPEDQRVATRHVGFATLPADRYPRTAATATTMARAITTEQFTWGLTRVLDGLPHSDAGRPDGCATDKPAAGQPPQP